MGLIHCGVKLLRQHAEEQKRNVDGEKWEKVELLCLLQNPI